MTDIVFTAINKHIEGCGEPPALSNNERNRYCSYFEGGNGDQWVFVYDFTTGEGRLYGGDVEWDKPVMVIDKKPPFVFDDSESAWYSACWRAVEAQKLLRGQS